MLCRDCAKSFLRHWGINFEAALLYSHPLIPAVSWYSAKFTGTQLKTGLVSLCFLEQSSGSALLKISAFLIYKTRKDYYVIPKILWLSFTVH